MLAIFSKIQSARLGYVLDLVFKDLLFTDYVLFTDKKEFENTELPRLNYSDEIIGDSLQYLPVPLLFEKGVQTQSIEFVKWKAYQVFFTVCGKSGLPFDPFALIFYLVSRYEEYLTDTVRDAHGRFKPESSVLFQCGMLEVPLVEIIVEELKSQLLHKYPDYKFPYKHYSFRPSYDIDMAFAHLGKSFLRSLGGFAKLFLKLQPKEIRGRVKTLLGLEKDPFDNFDLQNGLHQELNLKPVYFVNLGDYSRYDRNSSYQNEKLRDLLKKLSENTEVGVHPSYYSETDIEVIKEEKRRLEEITGKPVLKSRQHFLKLKFPDTYRRLISIGIQEDYSMGYASRFGFRAGISSPFYFFDLEKEEKTNLRIFPFAFMDTVFLDYLEIEPTAIAEKITPMIEKAKSLRTSLMGIWHNYAMADDPRRLQSYEEVLRLST